MPVEGVDIQGGIFLEESILKTVKKICAIDPECYSFDTDIIVFVNSSMATLNQLGVGPEEGFSITGDEETWDEFIPDDFVTLDMAKTYICHKTRLAFDPPQSSAVIEAIKTQLAEVEWRLLVQNNPKEEHN